MTAIAAVRAACAAVRGTPAVDCACGGPNQSAPCRAAALRAQPAWRSYLAATLRLRRLNTETAPRSLVHARFARVLDLERTIQRATGASFETVFDAAERDADAVARKYRRVLL